MERGIIRTVRAPDTLNHRASADVSTSPGPSVRGTTVTLSEPLQYEYDFFVSYRRHDPKVVEWVRGSLVSYLKPLVEAELGRTVVPFVDEQIEAGDMWSRRLEKALKTSAVLVPLLSKLYFTSEWCAREYDHFRDRETATGFRTDDRPEGLIVGAAIHDGDDFPDHVRELQFADLDEYFCLTVQPDNSAVLQPFLKAIRPFAKAIAGAIKRAPPRSATEDSPSPATPPSLQKVQFQKLPPRMIFP